MQRIWEAEKAQHIYIGPRIQEDMANELKIFCHKGQKLKCKNHKNLRQ